MPQARNRMLVAVAMLALVGVAGGRAKIAAHDDTATGFPAHVHTGTCDTLDPNPKYPLQNVHHGVIAHVEGNTDRILDAVRREADRAKDLAEKPFDEVKRAEERLRREHPDVIPVHLSETTVDVPLADLLASPHAINVHESNENIETYIACGDITGTVTGRDLAVALNPLSDSGYSGTAWLRAEGDKTVIHLFLAQSTGAEGTPTA